MANANIHKIPDPQTQLTENLRQIIGDTETRMICLKELLEADPDQDRYSAVLTFLEDIIHALQMDTARAETHREVTEKGLRAVGGGAG